MTLRFTDKLELAPNIWELRFAAERPVSFKPGQFVRFTIAGTEHDIRGSSRVFTLTSNPGDTTVRFIVKIVEPASPYKQALHTLKPGQEIHMQQPLGTFVLPKDQSSSQIICVARGIALASFVSMLNDANDTIDAHMLYSVRHKSEDISKHCIPSTHMLASFKTFYDPQHITARDILALYKPGDRMYVSGSQQFSEQIRANLLAYGVPTDKILFDYYDGYDEL